MYSISPKGYILKQSPDHIENNNEDVKKMKEVSMRLNTNIDLETYKNFLDQYRPNCGVNRGFRTLSLTSISVGIMSSTTKKLKKELMVVS
jgi:hypothetical protein